LNIPVYFHLEEHRSWSHLLQVLKEEHFARRHIAPLGEAANPLISPKTPFDKYHPMIFYMAMKDKGASK